MNIFSSKYFFTIVIAVQCCLWFVVKNDPFFGDAIASTSQAANHIYNQNLLTIFYPKYADPGHPTFYSYLLAIIWKIAGKTLWVSHAYSCVWALLLVYAFRKVAGQFLPYASVNSATFLVLVFPTYLAQSAMMLNTVALMSFFLVAVYGVLINNRVIICTASALMCITHLQAPFLLLSLAAFDFYRHLFLLKQFTLFSWIQNRFVSYSIPIVVFGSWLFVHHQHAGWLFLSPQYSDANQLNTLFEYVKAIALISWRLVDYGLLTVYIVSIVVFFKQPHVRKQAIQFLFLVLPCCLAMAIFLSNTIGHRYFMAFGMIAILFAILSIGQLKPIIQNAVFIFIFLSLLAGNFMYYPGKTLGDATLSYRNYFNISKSIQLDYGNTIFYSHAPIANPAELTYLQLKGLQCERINEKAFEAIPAIIQSNINAEFTQVEIDYLSKNWFGKSYENGAVYATVFFNPKFYNQTEQSSFRKISDFEKWMLGAKQKFK